MSALRFTTSPLRNTGIILSRFSASSPMLLRSTIGQQQQARWHSVCKNAHRCVSKRCMQTTIPKLDSSVVLSTALLEGVKQREEASAGKEEEAKPILEGGKGAEGSHFRQTETIVITPSDLQDVSRTGPWTMSHPVYTEEELQSVQVVRRAPITISDKIAQGLVKLSRTCYDLVTGYSLRHRPIPADGKDRSVQELRDGNHIMTPDQWLDRCLFLESIAGVPGMVAAVLRHLRSLRLMRRDGGWIATLLSEAENERMHLLTFMTLKQPSVLFRAMVLGAQGVFWNLFFIAYLVSPKSAHRFVGYLEEEACLTYTRCLEDMDKGRLPEWETMKAPDIAVDYWRLPAGATMKDVILSIRADESSHRFVNHSWANLDQKRDFNPFALKEADALTKGTKAGFTRLEAADFARKAHQEATNLLN